jgi:hypothetical protein
VGITKSLRHRLTSDWLLLICGVIDQFFPSFVGYPNPIIIRPKLNSGSGIGDVYLTRLTGGELHDEKIALRKRQHIS